MLSALILITVQQGLNIKQLEAEAIRTRQLVSPMLGLTGNFDAVTSKELGPYNSSEYHFPDIYFSISPRTGEVVILGGRMTSLANSRVNSDETAVEEAKAIFKLLRPKLFSQMSFKTIVYGNSFGVGMNREFEGVPVRPNGDSWFITFGRENGHFQSFRFPPTESGIHKIDKWLPESTANSTAVRFALDTFKGPTQLNLDSVKKTYVGENWFRGMPNPKHKAFSDPAFKEFLFPAYAVRYINADAIRKSDQAPMQLIDVYIDAENNSIFGYTIWAAGGSGIEPSKSLDGEEFDTIKLGSQAERKVSVTLTDAGFNGYPIGNSAILYNSTKVVKVMLDRLNRLVLKGKKAYYANDEFWKAL